MSLDGGIYDNDYTKESLTDYEKFLRQEIYINMKLNYPKITLKQVSQIIDLYEDELCEVAKMIEEREDGR